MQNLVFCPSIAEAKNPMLLDSEYRIQDQETSSAEKLTANYSPHDLAFEPTKYLVGLN